MQPNIYKRRCLERLLCYFSSINKNFPPNAPQFTHKLPIPGPNPLPIDQIRLIDFAVTAQDLEIDPKIKLSSDEDISLNRNEVESHTRLTSALDESVISTVKRIVPDHSIFTSQLAELSSYMRERLLPILGNDASYHFYGSSSTGLYTFNSDIDLSINLPSNKSRQSQIKLLHRIGEYLKKIYPQRSIEERFTARVPLLHWSTSARNSSSVTSSSGSAAVDICINNHLGIVNSSLISKYVEIDNRVSILIIAMKKWAKSRDINNKSRGSLGSFALVIMVIHYLQAVVSPPILPYLQDLAVATNALPNFVSGYDCRFANDELITISLQEMYKNYGKNSQSIGQLLLGLFKYYSQRSHDSPIISINQLGFFKSEMYENSLKYFVENPFEPGNDVANLPFNMESKINYEFARAYNILHSGATFTCIL